MPAATSVSCQRISGSSSQKQSGYRLHPRMMMFGYFALKDGDWEEYKRTFKFEADATEWAFERIRGKKLKPCTRNYVEE